MELLLYLAHKRPGADKYQAVKFFYLADRAHLNRHGRPITQESYFALPYGPVASKAMDLLEQDRWTMNEAGIEALPFAVSDESRKGKPVTVIGKPLREVNFELFSKSDLKVFDEVIAEFGKCTFEQLFEVTHDHNAYKKAWARRRPNSKRAEMYYDEMVESDELRQSLVEDFGGISQFLE
ncbi:Panacea domain-containing protein [Tabrizicola sp.]|uniref:Panacea domain-containing protein n=1 Tax=Tabrizicola sp. TaxID=2005166 RepID=UPI002736A8B0|nr:Panacea domain-containing protein [Tabrizicola sp.]